MKKKLTKKNKIYYSKRKKYNRKNYTNKSFNKLYNINKIYGGDDSKINNDKAISNIMDQVKAERKLNLGNNELIQKTKLLLQKLFINATDQIANMANVDLKSPGAVEEKLNQIKLALINPQNKEKLKQIISELGKNGIIVLQAASPFLKELADKVIDIGTKTYSKIGESIVKIGLNTVEEIPFWGILVGTIRNISNAGEAISAGTNAFSEIVTNSSDAIKATILNYNRIAKENGTRLNNINTSINEFNKPNIPPVPVISQRT